ncbi:PREDICTED: uncharacterized protein LOC106909583 isoform X4 [Poecilia mexicana]|uniref:uncharacterized protein LOC106909583 isoform X4 n=1 Tax=Poecilia mexicana TaxID=48701 RepID=UPI00072EB2D0|nr:PREDICTED: uncharacterized protein LOC106909583 isoform X4 [Poecilia mexicana]
MLFLTFCCLSSSSSSVRMKMISLLLLILSSCLCAATFVVNVTQSSYEAEENHSITLEWTFTTRTQGNWKNLFIYCEANTDHGVFVLYHVHDGVEFPDSQDDQFSGRVQSDKDVLREGRIRLHVSRLRTEDSGLYLCDVKTEDGFNSGRCRLNVTAAADVAPKQRPTLDPEAEGRGRIGLHVSLGLTAAVAAALIFRFFFSSIKHQKDSNNLSASWKILKVHYAAGQMASCWTRICWCPEEVLV